MLGVPGFNDIMFRGGVAYDLFGNGKTAIKGNLGQYVQSANNQDRYTTGNPANSWANTTNRNWNDANGNFIPDCDLMNPQANGECAQWSNLAFNQATSVNTVNPAILEGWGVRPSDRQYSVAIQHEIIPRVSVEFSYHWRTFQGFTVTDNRNLGPADFDRFTITVPNDPRLPNGGGYEATYLAQNVNRPPDNYVTFTDDYGNRSQYWHGWDFNANARLQNGLLFQGGTSMGKGVRDDCEIQAALPETLIVAGTTQQVESCGVVEPWLPTFRGLISYVIPRADVQLSAGLQFKPGIGNIGGNNSASSGDELNANWFAPRGVIEPVLGRRLLNNAAGQTINLVREGEVYGARINQVDLRVGKILRFGRTRALVGVDIYNLFNSNVGLSFNETFGVNYLRPTEILMPRFVRFNVTMDF